MPARLLSYVLDDDSGSATYLTWMLRPVADGCVLRLRIDETNCAGSVGSADSAEELEDVWLPVLDRLAAALVAA